VSTRTAASRQTILLAAIAAIALSMLYLIRPVAAADPFSPGQDGHPTSGESSDLDGGTATFTFSTSGTNAILTCNGDTPTSFSFKIDYNVTTTLGDNATLIVYLSPNQGAIENNANGDVQGYIDDVQSNFEPVDIGGLTGTGTLTVVVDITTSFQLSGGGVLGVIAETSSDEVVSTSKSLSVQCSEAQSVPPSAEGSVGASASAPASVPASGESSVKAGTGTPAASTSNTALFGDGSSPLPTVIFSLILLASLGALAYANVKTVRSRI
jgi:hypothetical protein